MSGEVFIVWRIVLQMLHALVIIFQGGAAMKKTISMSIRVSEDELNMLKQAARLEAYASYSEFIRRTALIEASKIIDEKAIKEDDKSGN